MGFGGMGLGFPDDARLTLGVLLGLEILVQFSFLKFSKL